MESLKKRYAWVKEKLLSEIYCPEDYYISASIIVALSAIAASLGMKNVFLSLVFCCLVMASLGFLLETKNWLLKFFITPSIRKLIFRLIITALFFPSLLAMSSSCTKSFIVNSVGLPPDYYTHTVDILFLVGVVITTLGLAIALLTLFYFCYSIYFLLMFIYNYLRDSFKHWKDVITNPSSSNITKETKAEFIESSEQESIRFMRFMGCFSVIYALIFVSGVNLDMKLLAQYPVFYFDHYSKNACKNFDLEENQRIGYYNSNTVSVATFHSFSNISFRIVECEVN